MSNHKFHTPCFGDEEFDIPVDIQHQQQTPNHVDQFSIQMEGILNQQTAWQSPTVQSNMMSRPTFHNFQPSTTTINANHVILNQQDILTQQLAKSQINICNVEEENKSNDQDDSLLRKKVKLSNTDPSDTENDNNKGTTIAAATKLTRKKKKDPKEPQKPVSSYALFFRDTQAAIKGQNPNASFGEVSKIVASMWDVLSPEHKTVYKKKQETAKKEYLKALASYRTEKLQKPIEDMKLPEVNDNEQSNCSQSQKNHEIQAQAAATPQISSAIQMQNQYGNNFNVQVQSVPLQKSIITSQVSINNSSNQPTLAPTQQRNQIQLCIRDGCPNAAMVNIDWEDEYCSNECVVIHCRDVFSSWAQNNIAIQHQSNATPLVN